MSLDPISKHFQKNSSSLGTLPSTSTTIPNVAYSSSRYGTLSQDAGKASPSPSIVCDGNNRSVDNADGSPPTTVHLHDIDVDVKPDRKNILGKSFQESEPKEIIGQEIKC